MKWVKELIPYVVIVLSVILIRTYIITPIKVNGASMEPTLFDKEVLLLQKNDRNFKRFDIIVLNYGKEKLIKRIIGLAGESIAYKNNKLWINDVIVEEPMINSATGDFDLEVSKGYQHIPEGYYFVMGDNRGNSVDGRLFGLIKKEDIIGKTNFAIYPLGNFGKID